MLETQIRDRSVASPLLGLEDRSRMLTQLEARLMEKTRAEGARIPEQRGLF
jgi:hypothetical protein